MIDRLLKSLLPRLQAPKQEAPTPPAPVTASDGRPYGRRGTDGQHWFHRVRGSLRQSQWASLFLRPPSFTNLLPWAHYDPKTQVFLLEEWRSVAALFELDPIPTEAATEAALEELSDTIRNVIAEAIPEDDGSPWVLQLFSQDDNDLSEAAEQYARWRDAHR